MEWIDGCFIILGAVSLIAGISVKLGGFKEYYWLQPLGYYRAVVYGFIPFGLALLILAVAPLFYNTVWLAFLRGLIVLFGLLGLFMWLFEPRFAKPDWINWVEDNHGDIVPELRRELWRMGAERKEIINDQT